MPAAAGVLSSAQQLQAQEIALSLQDISPFVMRAEDVGVAWLRDEAGALQPQIVMMMPRAHGDTLCTLMEQWECERDDFSTLPTAACEARLAQVLRIAYQCLPGGGALEALRDCSSGHQGREHLLPQGRVDVG